MDFKILSIKCGLFLSYAEEYSQVLKKEEKLMRTEYSMYIQNSWCCCITGLHSELIFVHKFPHFPH